jgi:hypothetical protein
MTHQQALDTMASERYLLGEMTERERHVFEDHYFSCEECAEDVRAGGLMREGAKTAFAGAAPTAAADSVVRPDVRPIRSKRRPFPVLVALPWAAAATLAVVAGYESFLLLPALRRDSAPQAVTPLTLRPASRGQEPIVRSGVSGAPVILAVDINGATNGELAYDLRGPDGTQVASGRASVPSPGMPLYLLVPGRSLTAAGAYMLRVRGAADGHELGEYRFSVAAR